MVSLIKCFLRSGKPVWASPSRPAGGLAFSHRNSASLAGHTQIGRPGSRAKDRMDRRTRRKLVPGEAGASEQLNRFLKEALFEYPTRRDHPDRTGTSGLSPHIHFGEISVRQIWFALRGQLRSEGTTGALKPSTCIAAS